MKYLVIGLGNLGRAIAKDLTRVGNEVIGVDMNLHRVDMLKNDIAGAVALDSTDKEALSTLPLSEMDAEILLEIDVLDGLPDKSGRCLDLIEMFRVGYFIPMPEQAA